ncbi:MAG: Two component regulator propeller [Methanoregulaceae archaeon PtaU1.Bin222]|nr:MAG: Two component regulator propeller [Methanoregulaceae archaeon PtaU1.Bin222]
MERPAYCNSASCIRLTVFFVLVSAIAGFPAAAATGTNDPYTITLFIPARDSIPATQIMDLINEYNSSGNILIATSYGLSRYDGTWTTRHMTLSNLSEGLLDDFITSIEYDSKGNLWIGYSEGIQIYNGVYYTTLRDQEFFKSLRINDIQRWHNEMWIATGNAGLHRYRDGNWTWFQPFSPGGPGFYEANAMIWDHDANATLIATAGEGIWMIRSQDDPVIFECIASRDSTYGLLDELKKDHSGGVYFFNDSVVAHYSTDEGFVPVLVNSDLAVTDPPINDLVSGPDGKLYLATDNGIYIWEDGRVFRHLSRFEGIGTNSIAHSINIDRMNRIWFSTPVNIGYYLDQSNAGTPLDVQIAITATTSTAAPVIPAETIYQRAVPTLREEGASPSATKGAPDNFLDGIIQTLREFFSGIGLKPRF